MIFIDPAQDVHSSFKRSRPNQNLQPGALRALKSLYVRKRTLNKFYDPFVWAHGRLSTLERYTSGADRSRDAARAIFFILHLAGERQDTRVSPLLCRLAQDGEAIEAVLGDGVTTTLKRILISTYDGDLDTLKGLIEAAEADEFVRAGALEVLAYLTATKRITREEAEASLLRLYNTLQPQHQASCGALGAGHSSPRP